MAVRCKSVVKDGKRVAEYDLVRQDSLVPITSGEFVAVNNK